MAIPEEQLDLVIKNTSLSLVRGRLTLRSTYQVIAPSFDALIAEASFDQYIDNFGEFEAKDAVTFSAATGWHSTILEWHRARDTLVFLSFHDASLSLAHWVFSKPGNLWTISHPVSGEFSNIKIAVKDGRPTLRGRVEAVIESVPPPPTWSWAESTSPEELTTRCIQVSGADSYNVYGDLGNGKFILLGSVPDHTPRTISVSAGVYRVRMAAVDGGVIGVMGNDNQVQVDAVAAMEAMSYSVVEPAQPEKKNRLVEWVKSLGK